MLPPNVKLDTASDTVKESSNVLSRKIKLVKKDGTESIETEYVPLTAGNAELQLVTASTVQLGDPLRSRIFQVNCGMGSAVEIKNGSAITIVDEAETIKLECRELQREKIKQTFFTGMKPGDSKMVATSEPPLLSDAIETLGVGSMKITLLKIDTAAQRYGTFGVQAEINPKESVGKRFPKCDGLLNLAENGTSMELNLKCSSNESETLTDGSVVKTLGELKLIFIRKIL